MKRPRIAAVSFKAYFSIAQTNSYCRYLAQRIGDEAAVVNGEVQTAVFPSYIAIPSVMQEVENTPIMVGAQDVGDCPRGAFTGEVPAQDLREIGCTLVEIGHAERRNRYGETPEIVERKVNVAFSVGLVPLLCIGESEQIVPKKAAEKCVKQVVAAASETHKEIWLGYEPYWAIGAQTPAPASYVMEVCSLITEHLRDIVPQARLLYGGSAGPGLVKELGESVDGLFLGRFAHKPEQFLEVVREMSI